MGKDGSGAGETSQPVGRELLHDLADGARELLWPTRCVGCDFPGELLCEECRAHLPWIEQRWACPVCGAPFGWLVCTACGRLDPPEEALVPQGGCSSTQTSTRSTTWNGDCEPRSVVAALSFERGNVAARMAAGLKDGHELRLAGVMAAVMQTALEEASFWPALDGGPRFDLAETDAICFVPATAEAYRRRGFDHMELVAGELARQTGLPVVDALVRASSADQRDLGREDRAANLAHTVRCVDDLSGMDVLLVDDVVTTGSTLHECTRALIERGCASVTCAALTRVW